MRPTTITTRCEASAASGAGIELLTRCCSRATYSRSVSEAEIAAGPRGRVWQGNHMTPEYRTWYAKRDLLCKRWRQFERFQAVLGPRPNGCRLYRIDCRKNYSPGNCCWSKYRLPRPGRRMDHAIRIDSVLLTLVGWARLTGQKYVRLHKRFRRGWTPREIVYGKRGAVETSKGE